jgi:hypothetical protein
MSISYDNYEVSRFFDYWERGLERCIDVLVLQWKRISKFFNVKLW